jgi:hypothetical protein
MAGLAGFFTFTQGRERPPGTAGRGVSRIRPDLAQFELCDEYAVALPGEQPRQIGLPAPESSRSTLPRDGRGLLVA